MTRPRKPKSPSKMDPRAKHIRIYRYVLESPAYRSLSSVARDVLNELLYRYSGTNNGYIPLGHREALERAGTGSNRAIADAFRELQSKGFIRPRVLGSFNMKKRHVTDWIITTEAYAGHEATKDFVHWHPTDENKTRGAICMPTGCNLHTVVPISTARKARK